MNTLQALEATLAADPRGQAVLDARARAALPWCIARYRVNLDGTPHPLRPDAGPFLDRWPPHNLCGPLSPFTHGGDLHLGRVGFPRGRMGRILRFATEAEAQSFIDAQEYRPPIARDIPALISSLHFYVVRWDRRIGNKSEELVYDGGDHDEAVVVAAQEDPESTVRYDVHTRPTPQIPMGAPRLEAVAMVDLPQGGAE